MALTIASGRDGQVTHDWHDWVFAAGRAAQIAQC
jgi:hypothetical protein